MCFGVFFGFVLVFCLACSPWCHTRWSEAIQPLHSLQGLIYVNVFSNTSYMGRVSLLYKTEELSFPRGGGCLLVCTSTKAKGDPESKYFVMTVGHSSSLRLDADFSGGVLFLFFVGFFFFCFKQMSLLGMF